MGNVRPEYLTKACLTITCSLTWLYWHVKPYNLNNCAEKKSTLEANVYSVPRRSRSRAVLILPALWVISQYLTRVSPPTVYEERAHSLEKKKRRSDKHAFSRTSLKQKQLYLEIFRNIQDLVLALRGFSGYSCVVWLA